MLAFRRQRTKEGEITIKIDVGKIASFIHLALDLSQRAGFCMLDQAHSPGRAVSGRQIDFTMHIPLFLPLFSTWYYCMNLNAA
ncbi:MAG: hypothetical protein DMF61_00150 [Blastocatellia bacterium AA13]|nr:MAG: hypothetical protein DMF61_00150 [Blastocatellia bacterium AA13]